MIRVSSLFTLSCLFLFFSSCGPSDKTDYQTLIDETCRCLQPMVEFNNRSQEAIASRDSARLAVLAQEFTQLQESTRSCTETVDEEFGNLSPEQEGKAISLLEKTCPDVAELMKGAQE